MLCEDSTISGLVMRRNRLSHPLQKARRRLQSMVAQGGKRLEVVAGAGTAMNQEAITGCEQDGPNSVDVHESIEDVRDFLGRRGAGHVPTLRCGSRLV